MDQQISQKERATERSAQTVLERRAGKITENIQLQALKVEMVEIHLLKPNPYNPNKQQDEEFALLRQSIRSDGFTMPILCNRDLTIIDGEHRWQAGLAENIKVVPVVRLDLDDARMKMSTIRHNKATGSHDAGLEAMVLADLEKLAGKDFIQRELMIDSKALEEILNFTSAPDMLAGDEFNPSWTPVKNDSAYEVNEQGNPEVPSTFHARNTVDSAIVLRSATQGANKQAYLKVKEHSKEAGMKNLYTLSAVFNPEEAIHVQKVLENPAIQGSTPAERLLSLAQAYSQKASPQTIESGEN